LGFDGDDVAAEQVGDEGLGDAREGLFDEKIERRMHFHDGLTKK
jgi:hypothetical protein